MPRISLLLLMALLQAGRLYWIVTVDDLARGRNFHTHVQITGRVALVKHEADGDTHIQISGSDSSRWVVAECIPSLPCKLPRVGQIVTVKGISRFDGEHKFYEVHPVEELTIQ